jgi:3-oxoacyl-[acyl-carrier protein] reductase
VNDRPLAGKRVIITGASRGIGRAAALACAEAGADLVVNGRDEERLGQVAELAAVDALGGVDCLLNNAGITRDRTLGKMSAEEFDDVLAVNLRGTWACGKLAAAAMREGSGGSIVNVVSNTAFSGAIGQTNYGAAKAGVAGMTRTWTRELERYGIRVNGLWPIAETDMTRVLIESMLAADSAATDAASLGFGDPGAIAAIVIYLFSDAAADVNGQMISFNGSKLALWNHPSEVVAVHRSSWDPKAIEREFAGPLGRCLQPYYDAF